MNRADLSTSIEFCELVVFDLLNSDLTGTKVNVQWNRHIGQLKMAATQKLIVTLLANQKLYTYK